MTYDCFSFFNELDLLEIRFNILDPYVDFFVLGESTETFSGKEKPLYYELNKERFAKWNHKVIHVVSPKIEVPDAFERAGFQKEYLKTGLKDAKDHDVVYFGDLDEIWKPQGEMGDLVCNLQQLNYCYFLDNRSSENWVGTIVGRWKTIKTNTFNHWRAHHDHELPDGGWHFTNCMGYANILKKLESYDHQEFNTEEVKANLKERMDNGQDHVGRSADWQGKPFEMWQDDSELPIFLLEHKNDYKHLFR